MTTTKLEEIIQNLLNTHKGGEKYFDNFDAEMLKEENLDIIIDFIDSVGYKNIAVSGKFGSYVALLYMQGLLDVKSVVKFNGGLRKGGITDITFIGKGGYENKEFVFIDDSFYKGRTRDKVAEYLERNNSRIVHTSVIYDGSLEQEEEVTSLFRYH